MSHANLTKIQPIELLEALKVLPDTEGFQLSLYCEVDGYGPRGEGSPRVCGIPNGSRLCGELCQNALEEAVKVAMNTGNPQVYRCHADAISFVVPFRFGDSAISCIIGGGFREKELDVSRVESLARAKGLDPFAVLDELEHMPAATVDDIRLAAEKIHEIIPSLQAENIHTILLEKAMQRLSAISAVSCQIDALDSLEEILAVVSETLGVLFDLSRIAFLEPEGDGGGFVCRGLWGLPADLGKIQPGKMSAFLPSVRKEEPFVLEEDIQALFPEIASALATCVPLTVGEVEVGILILFDQDMHERDLLPIRLLTGRAALRLLHIRSSEAHRLESSIKNRLMAMIGDLAMTESKSDLFRQLLDMAAELAGASNGSFMLLEEGGDSLRIESAIGMNLKLAQSMIIRVGVGIAGKVAANGNPLLVNDIENDRRLGIPNRPRFRTKSFVSIPVKLRDTVLGVLNLSDKKNEGIFNDADLKLLINFTGHASIILERVFYQERFSVLEQLSITDPLTALYNRRFLKQRIEEELSRSIRQQLHLTVILIDLDHFKLYNDLCGHLAGDKALKRTSKILRNSARQMDVVARYGGEEFCVVLPGTSKKESIFVADRIRREIENEEFPHEENLPLGRLTVSLGIASFPDDGCTETSLLRAADAALYRAKAEGRNRIVISEGTADGAASPEQARGLLLKKI